MNNDYNNNVINIIRDRLNLIPYMLYLLMDIILIKNYYFNLFYYENIILKIYQKIISNFE